MAAVLVVIRVSVDPPLSDHTCLVPRLGNRSGADSKANMNNLVVVHNVSSFFEVATHPPSWCQYRGTLLVRRHPPIGPYRRPMPMILGGS